MKKSLKVTVFLIAFCSGLSWADTFQPTHTQAAPEVHSHAMPEVHSHVVEPNKAHLAVATRPVAGNVGHASPRSTPQNRVCAPVNSEKCKQERNNWYSGMGSLNTTTNQNGGIIGYNPYAK